MEICLNSKTFLLFLVPMDKYCGICSGYIRLQNLFQQAGHHMPKPPKTSPNQGQSLAPHHLTNKHPQSPQGGASPLLGVIPSILIASTGFVQISDLFAWKIGGCQVARAEPYDEKLLEQGNFPASQTSAGKSGRISIHHNRKQGIRSNRKSLGMDDWRVPCGSRRAVRGRSYRGFQASFQCNSDKFLIRTTTCLIAKRRRFMVRSTMGP